jgi:SAM-dependent methyltransferase
MSSNLAYSSQYYEGIRSASGRSAHAVVPLVIELTRPQSVVDVGCGSGAWTSAFKEAGVKSVLGIDGFYVKDEQLVIPPENFKRADLTQRLELHQQFDLAVSLEVAEHLPPARAKTFIEDLCRLSPVVLFSGAVPGQGGTHHLNEQWPSYWVKLFQETGYQPFDVIRPKIWNNDQVAWWFRQNILLFLRREVIPTYPWAVSHPKTDVPVDLVHPKAYEAAALPCEMSPRMLKAVAQALPHFPGKIVRHLKGSK